MNPLGMRAFKELVAEAVSADVAGWGFEWLGNVESGLDLDTGGGEVLADVPAFPRRMVATESWPPNVQRARELLEPRGVQIVGTVNDAAFPFPDESFELVSARHPVVPM